MSANPHAKIHALKGQLNMHDDDYRMLMERETGQRSSTKLTGQQRAKVVRIMEGMLGKRSDKLQGPFAGKLQALWIAGYNLGLIRDRSDAAMLVWIKGQTGIENTRFLINAEDARKAVEGLKQMLARAGVNWKRSAQNHWTNNDDRWRIVCAQWAILVSADKHPAPSIAQFITRHTNQNELSKLTDRQWIGIMNALGVFVRKATSVK